MEHSTPASPAKAGEAPADGSTLPAAASRGARADAASRGLTRRRRKPRGLVWYAFVGPPFLLLLLFVLYPTFETFRQGLYQQVGTHQKFAGTTQFSQLFHSSTLWHALENTVLLGVAYLAIVIPLAVILASLLNKV